MEQFNKKRAKLKTGELRIGNNKHFKYANGEIVTITAEENSVWWGKRYKILGCDEWFEENCFEYILED